MLEQAMKTQLKSYLERLQWPIELVASLDDSAKSQELLALLQDCRDAARTTSDSLNTLFFAHSGESSQSVGA